MKHLLRPLLTLLLTVPIFLLVARIEPVPRWLFSHRGHETIAPLLRLYGTIGVEDYEEVVAYVLLTLSFVIAVVLAWGAPVLVRQLRRSRTPVA